MNKHGLSRHIPESVKRAVRQRDGYGCVYCGNAIYTYEHLDPEFVDAHSHEVTGIVLLCEQCAGKKTRGLLSVDSVRRSAANPKCKEQGFSRDFFDIGGKHPEIVIGTIRGREAKTLISIMGDDVLSIHPPEIEGGPFLIDAKLMDENGRVILDISKNEWRTPIDNWDVELVGRRLTIRRGLADIALVIRSDPPDSITIERINMEHRGTRIVGQEGQSLRVSTLGGSQFDCGGAVFEGCEVAIEITEDGISLGKGGGSLYIENAFVGAGPRVAFPSPMSWPPMNHPFMKMRRNSPCPCGSGLKYKKCHGKFPQGSGI